VPGPHAGDGTLRLPDRFLLVAILRHDLPQLGELPPPVLRRDALVPLVIVQRDDVGYILETEFVQLGHPVEVHVHGGRPHHLHGFVDRLGEDVHLLVDLEVVLDRAGEIRLIAHF
jgi:hypothetical protein